MQVGGGLKRAYRAVDNDVVGYAHDVACFARVKKCCVDVGRGSSMHLISVRKIRGKKSVRVSHRSRGAEV